VEVLALLEANRIVAVLERGGARPDDLPLDPRLVRLLEADVRIVLTWDTDQTDMDLWVVEPTGEKCFYSHPLTTLGGRISKDFTGGYGPEEYMVRRARPGLYRVKANYYGSRAQGLAGPTTVQATVITDFGRPEEKRRSVTLRLTEARDVVDVGEVRFDPSR
jgi:Ca-activated chloride channel family protein